MKNSPATAAPDFLLEADPPAPARKRAVKKTALKAVKKKAAAASSSAVSAADPAPEAVPAEAPAAVRFEPAPAFAPAPEPEPGPAPAAKKTPARKAAAKKTAVKTARKKAAAAVDSSVSVPAPPVLEAPSSPAAPVGEPDSVVSPEPPEPERAPRPVAKKAVRRTARKAAPAVIVPAETETVAVSETAPVPEQPEVSRETPPVEDTARTEAAVQEPPAPPVRQQPHPRFRTQPHDRTPPSGGGEEWSPGAGGGKYPPRHARPARPPVPAPQHFQQPQPPADGERPPRQEGGFQDTDTVIGPDGQPRRLNKWERWKLRKEKFKLQKQQQFLERQAAREGRTGPGAPDGGAAPHHAPHGFRERPPRPERPEPPPLGPPEEIAGLLEMTPKGFAFLRPAERSFAALSTDPFVSPELIRQFGLREGVWIEGIHRRSPRGSQVTEITKVNGLEPDAYRTLPLFEELTAINPNKRFILETTPTRYTTRIIDFIAPIGRGQRGLIVAPPRAGKTTFLQHIAEAVLENYKGVKVIVLLVDERPEEVTEIARALPGAEIMASSNDQDPRNHIRMAELAVARAKRLVEAGEHVFMLLDSITRLARGFNNSMRGGGGKAMSGGIDSRALEAPRRLFAAARNTREAGSLTIIATALVETNNKGDDLIFQEFKGTGNMELVLDRKIAQQYVYPAVDIFKSGTRREELLLPPHQLEKIHLIRRGLAGHRPVEAMERLLQFMQRFPNNAQMLIEIKSRE